MIWLCRIWYSRSFFCFSSATRLSIRVTIFSDILLMPRPMEPSSWFHSISLSLEKSPSAMASIFKLSRLMGWLMILFKRMVSRQPREMMAALIPTISRR